MAEKLLTIPEVAEILQISRRQVERMAARGTFGPKRIRLSTHAVRVRAAELDDWIREGAPPEREWWKLQEKKRRNEAKRKG